MIGLYLGQSRMASKYGAAGSAAVGELVAPNSAVRCPVYPRVRAAPGTTMDPELFAESALQIPSFIALSGGTNETLEFI